ELVSAPVASQHAMLRRRPGAVANSEAYTLHVLERTVHNVHAALLPGHTATHAFFFFAFSTFSFTAARTSALNAFSSTASPSRMSMARRRLPSRLALNRPAGSGSAAPWAKVIFTAVL